MKKVHDAGPLYCWVARTENEQLRTVRFGFVRNIEPPFRTGRGLEFRIRFPSVHLAVRWRRDWRVPVHLSPVDVGFGLINVLRRKIVDEDLGLSRVGVIGKTVIDDTGEEIGDWDVSEETLEAEDLEESPALLADSPSYRELVERTARRNPRRTVGRSAAVVGERAAES